MLAASIVIHEIPISFTIGSQLYSKGFPLSNLKSILLFSVYILSMPIGMIIGMLITNNDDRSSSISIVIIQGISGGIFVYLAAMDLIVH